MLLQGRMNQESSVVKQTAVITGASSGIGKELAEQLSRYGYSTVIAARSISKLNAIAKNINSQGGRCLSVPTDVAIQSDIQNLAKKASQFGKVSILINNAGMGRFGFIEELSIDDWNNQLDVNLRGAFLASQAFVPIMKENKMGVLVFINSIAGRQPFSQSTAYVASKFGLRGLASSLREELREHNIKVISVYPGAVDTPFWDKVKNNFPRKDMLDSKSLAKSIIDSILAPGNLTIEEMVIRRISGDF